MRETVFIDRFSAGLDDLTRKQQASVTEVLSVLDRVGRFSIFEATDNQTIASTMTHISNAGYVELDISCGFPWTKVKLTDKGRDLLEKRDA